MIFAHTLEAVLEGRKTQTRRLVKPGDTPTFISANSFRFYPDLKDGYSGVKRNERWLWHINQERAVQPGRGKKAVARIAIEYIRRERVCDISEVDAIAEGFESVNKFIETFMLINPKSTLESDVWVIEFKLVTP